MKKIQYIFLSGVIFGMFFSGYAAVLPRGAEGSGAEQKTDERLVMKAVADYQIAAYGDVPRANWKSMVFMLGLIAASEPLDDPSYVEFVNQWGEKASWEVSSHSFHADGISSGYAFLKLYQGKGRQNPEMIADVQMKLGEYFGKETVYREELVRPRWLEESREFCGSNVWWWCDALMFAPPILAGVSEVTGDSKYLTLLDSLYWSTVDFLYDKDDHLFYRDASYFFESGWSSRRSSPSGSKVFWCRGNGWVIAGLAFVLESIPDEHPARQRYLNLFQQLAASVVRYQQDDGLWRSAIQEPDWYPEPETSGSSLLCYALASGINHGWLDYSIYGDAAEKAWEGLVAHVNDAGQLGYSQLVASGPGPVAESDVSEYGQGAFLMAGSEIIKMRVADNN
jgi:rhamnogalacturonyl hydrolase YesR